MKDLTKISNVYFIGIGGIGMSALAKYYLSQNATVSGYDKTVTSLTIEMEKEGIRIHYEDNIDLLDRNAQLVVYTPAVPKDHKELNYYLQHNYEVIKRSALLGEITKYTYNICVAGTHGKTTISTMIAHILRDSGFGCNAFLGGISVNYQTNFWKDNNTVAVVEADEYDRSFLQLSPDVAVISSMDADHLDIYGTKENMEAAFVEFSDRLKPGGLLLTNYNLAVKKFSAVNYIQYSLQDPKADAFATNITLDYGGYKFDVIAKNWVMEGVHLNMGGMHNIENTVASIVIAHHLNIDPVKIREAVKKFKGVKRRFEYIIPPSFPGHHHTEVIEAGSHDVIFIDDYAHHPQELKALITGAKSLFNGKHCTIIFQPHLFSRTRDLAEGFAESLDQADEIFLLPIYPARELPLEGITSDTIIHHMKNKNVTLITKGDLMNYIRGPFIKSLESKKAGSLLITAGAGDIDQLVQPIKEALLNNNW